MTNSDIIKQIQSKLNDISVLLGQLQLDSVAVPTPTPQPVPTPQPTPNPSPTNTGGGVISGTNTPTKFPVTSPIACVMLSLVVAEKPGAQLHNIILSANDFNILKSNDHVFTVIPVNPPQFMSIPNTSIHDLNVWIKNNSVTKVPDVPANNV